MIRRGSSGSMQVPGAAVLLWLLLSVAETSTSWAEARQLGGRRAIDENFVEGSIPHNGLTRWFLEYRPQTPLPNNTALVLVLHGGTSSMRTIFERNRRGTTRWVDLCVANGFVLIAPNGVNFETGDTKGDDQNWNDLREEFGSESIDDVGFLASLVAWAVANRGVNPNRVYITGASNGGMMSYRAVIESNPPIYAAAAAFIASLPVSEVPPPNKSTAIFIMNGTKDKLVKWEGGTVGNERGEVRSSLATRDYWIQANRADKNNVQRSTLPNERRLDGCRISSEFYPATNSSGTNNTSNVTSSAPVQFYTMDGGGHMVPYTGFGRYSLLYRLLAGPACRDADGADLAWDFMSRYTL